MPIYDWVDENTGKEVVVQRTFDDYDAEPVREEAINQGLTSDESKAADWVRLIGKGIQVIKGDGWGKKGSW